MNRKLLLLLLLFLSIVADSQTPLVQNGFYRARNQTTQRYISVVDNYGYIDYQSTSADLGAIVSYNFGNVADAPNWNYEKILSNPATIVYTEYNSGTDGYNLYCQGANTYSIVASYLKVSSYSHNGKSAYQMYASKSGILRYLNDAVNYGENESYLEAGSFGEYSHWDVLPLSTAGENYFGMLPTCSVGNDHYLSFYASFPFSFYSDGMKGYYVNIVDKDLHVAVINEIGANKTDIPGGMPMIVKCSSSNPSDNRLDIHTSTATLPNDNLLKGVYFCNVKRQATNPHNDFVLNNPETMRVLGVLSDGAIGLKVSDEKYIAKNTCYLEVEPGTPSELYIVTPEEYEQLKDISVDSVIISDEAVSIPIGGSHQLSATVKPDNATNKNIQWSSSDENVAIVSENGLVTGKTKGTVIITAAAVDGSGKFARCGVLVYSEYAESITLNMNSAEMTIGDTLQLSAEVLPETTANKGVSWMTSSPDVAEVDENGRIIAVGAGVANITAMTKDGTALSAVCSIIVSPVFVESITMSQTTAEIVIGDTLQLTAKVLPENATDKNLTWSTSASDVATVDETGKVIAVGAGVANITVMTKDGTALSASCEVVVTSPIPPQPTLFGDANADGEINVNDITTIATYILKGKADSWNFKNADVNEDGIINVNDITGVAAIILKK